MVFIIIKKYLNIYFEVYKHDVKIKLDYEIVIKMLLPTNGEIINEWFNSKVADLPLFTA